MNQPSQNQFEFGDYVLIPNEYQLLRCGESVPITNTSFDLLQLLIENAGSLVSEEHIFETVWESRIVAQNNISVRIDELRKIFGDQGRPRRFIDNKRGRGYKFVYPVTPIANQGGEVVTASATSSSPKPRKPNYRQWTNEVTGFTETVKIGWSWPAFLFGGLWGFAKRMLLVGSCMLGASLLVGYALAVTLSDEDFDYPSFFATVVFGLLFGAYGNRWREWHLRRRGFSPTGSFFYNPVTGFLSWLFARLKAAWRGSLSIKVSAGILLLLVTVGIGIYYWAATPPHTEIGCGSAKLFAKIVVNEEETSVWFEWGETPDLGNSTMKQRFREDDYYYQDLINLNKDMKYFYRAMASNVNGQSVGRVDSFVPDRCK